MSQELNILTINSKILKNFKDEKKKINEYKIQLESINKSLELPTIKTRLKDTLLKSKDNLEKHINDIENNVSLNFYIADTAEILDKYREILNSPMKINFMGKSTKENKDKEELILKYVEIANKYVNININKKLNF